MMNTPTNVRIFLLEYIRVTLLVPFRHTERTKTVVTAMARRKLAKNPSAKPTAVMIIPVSLQRGPSPSDVVRTRNFSGASGLEGEAARGG